MSGKDRPILFSGPMVRALLDGRKTQTRRVVKLNVPDDADEVFFWSGEPLRRQGWRNVSEPGLWARRNGRDGYIRFIGRCPYGVPGDRLWVKERGWMAPSKLAFIPFVGNVPPEGDTFRDPSGQPYRARPSIHMPRWASRLTLQITDVRVERLQDLSEADALAEGVREPSLGDWISTGFVDVRRESCPPVTAFALLWESINGKASWDANPWVWAVSFEVAS